jgi:hypothetical protein
MLGLGTGIQYPDYIKQQTTSGFRLGESATGLGSSVFETNVQDFSSTYVPDVSTWSISGAVTSFTPSSTVGGNHVITISSSSLNIHELSVVDFAGKTDVLRIVYGDDVSGGVSNAIPIWTIDVTWKDGSDFADGDDYVHPNYALRMVANWYHVIDYADSTQHGGLAANNVLQDPRSGLGSYPYFSQGNETLELTRNGYSISAASYSNVVEYGGWNEYNVTFTDEETTDPTMSGAKVLSNSDTAGAIYKSRSQINRSEQMPPITDVSDQANWFGSRAMYISNIEFDVVTRT